MDMLTSSADGTNKDAESMGSVSDVTSKPRSARTAFAKWGRMVALWGTLCAGLAGYGAAFRSLTPVSESVGAFVKARERSYASCLRASAWRSASTDNVCHPGNVAAELSSAVLGMAGMSPQQAPAALLQETQAAIGQADRPRLKNILLRIDTLRNARFPSWVATVGNNDRVLLDLLGAHVCNLIDMPLRAQEIYLKELYPPSAKGGCGTPGQDGLVRSEMALSLMQMGHLQEAAKALDLGSSGLSLEQDSSQWLPLLARARLDMLEGKYKSAIDCLDVVLAAPTSSAEASTNASACDVFRVLLEDAFYEARLLKLTCRVSRDEDLKSPAIDMACVHTYFTNRGASPAAARVDAIQALWVLKTQDSRSTELAAARRDVQNAVTTLEQVGYRDDLIFALDALCQVDQARADWRSVAHVNKLIVLGERSGNLWAKAQGLHHRSKILVGVYGDYPRAERELTEAVEIMKGVGSQEWVAYSSYKRADFALERASALRKCGKGQEAREQLGIAQDALSTSATANTKSAEERGNSATVFGRRIAGLRVRLARERRML